MTTSGPNPWFWAQNHGFGPDVVTFGVNPSKTTKNDFMWPKPRFWAREPGFGPDVVILGVLGGNPRKCAACVARPWAQPLKSIANKLDSSFINRATPSGCRRPWPWLCHGADDCAADPASLDLRFSKGPPRTPFQDHSKIHMGFGSESERHGMIFEAFWGPLNPPKYVHHEHGRFEN